MSTCSLQLAIAASAPTADKDVTPVVNVKTEPSEHNYPFYLGAILGWGNTNWQEMISLDGVSSTSTPVSAGGTGFAGGVVGGVRINRYFALEANYTHFPTSHITFAPNNVYGITSFDSNTNEYSLLGKFMVPVGHTKFSAFSEIGPAYVQRSDEMAHKGHFGGGFGVGADYDINQHWFTELGLQYYTGYGESELKPAYDYIPFLYTINARIAYRF